jgi:hypothetical protein
METDATIACNIVRKLFKHINDCLQNDRSKIKLNMLEKGAIKTMLSEKALNGINRYIVNMNQYDIKILMDDLEVEIKKREIKK